MLSSNTTSKLNLNGHQYIENVALITNDETQKNRPVFNLVLKQWDDNNIEFVVFPDGEEHNLNQTPSFANVPELNDDTEPNFGSQECNVSKNCIIEGPSNSKALIPPSSNNNASTEPKKSILYECFKCSKNFLNLSLFRRHLKRHKIEKYYHCSKCAAGYNIEDNLKIHMVLNHNTANTKCCPICEVNFQRTASLKSHVLVHQIDELWPCEKCRVEFENEDELLKHMEGHSLAQERTASRSFECHKCNLNFESSDKYFEHLAQHSAEKRPNNTNTRGSKYRNKVKKKGTRGCWKCKHCGKLFSKYCLVERHERIHTGEKPFKCNICDKAFTQNGSLQIHLNKHTGLRPYACALCPAKFSQKGNLRVHIERIHSRSVNEPTYKCTECKCLFRKLSSLNGHMTKVHLNQCNDPIEGVMNGLRELEKSTSKKSYSKSPSTLVSSDTQTDLVKVAEDHVSGDIRRYIVRQQKIDDVRWYFCNYCSVKFKKPSDLIRHFRTHTMERPFKCTECHQSFSLKTSLTNHLKIHQKSRSVSDPCKKCNQQNCHCNEAIIPNYACLLCQEVFNTFDEAREHRVVHVDKIESTQNIIEPLLKQPLYQTAYGPLPLKPPKRKVPNTESESPLERPHHCKICNARFVRLMSYNRHMLSHTGERKFKCNLCPKAFTTRYRLKEHLDFHNNIKKFACQTCGKKFVTASLLKRHTIVHNNVRPYMCPYCEKHFKTVLLCRHHIRVVHKTTGLAEHKKKVSLLQEEVNEPPALPADGAAHKNWQTVYLKFNDDQTSPEPERILNDDASLKLNDDDPYLLSSLNDIQQQFNKSRMVDPNDVIGSVALVQNQSDLLTETEADAAASDAPFFDESSIQLPTVNLESIPISVINTEPEENLLSNELITADTQFICINCQKICANYDVFWKHSCSYSAVQVEEPLELFVSEQLATGGNSITLNQATLKIDGSDQMNASISMVARNTLEDQNVKAINEVSPSTTSSLQYRNEHTPADKPLVPPEKTNYKCDYCSFETTAEEQFRKHASVHPEFFDRNCRFCLKKFKKPSDLARHLRTHTGERPFDCDKCRKKFSLKSTLESHMKTHDVASVNRITCQVCNASYTTKSSLKVHMLLHTGDRPHRCNYCEQTFRTSAIRKSHERNTHLLKNKRRTTKKSKLDGPKVVQLVAEEVAKNVSRENLEGIGQSSTVTYQAPDPDTAPVFDPVVQDSLALDSVLLLQQIDQSGIIITGSEGAMPVNLDNITVLDVKNLQLHEDLGQDASVTALANDAATLDTAQDNQSQKRKVECDICHKMYASKDVLRKHRKTIHVPNRQFPCIKCDKGYDKLEELQKHIAKLHNGSRPYSCSYCENSFSEEKSLKTHIKRIHQKAPAAQETTDAVLGLQYDFSLENSLLT